MTPPLLTDADKARCWEILRQGAMFRIFVDEKLNEDIDIDRKALEKCSASDLPRLQAQIAARRDLLGFFARKDKSQT